MTAFTLLDFVRESNRIEGIHRAPTERELHAHEDFLSVAQVDILALAAFVNAVQPGAVLRNHPDLNVRVGRHVAPRGGRDVVGQLQALLNAAQQPRSLIINGMDVEPAHAAHIAYEHLHPFTDGNGRSGRALWLWMIGGIERAPLGFLHHFYYQTLQATHSTVDAMKRSHALSALGSASPAAQQGTSERFRLAYDALLGLEAAANMAMPLTGHYTEADVASRVALVRAAMEDSERAYNAEHYVMYSDVDPEVERAHFATVPAAVKPDDIATLRTFLSNALTDGARNYPLALSQLDKLCALAASPSPASGSSKPKIPRSAVLDHDTYVCNCDCGIDRKVGDLLVVRADAIEVTNDE